MAAAPVPGFIYARQSRTRDGSESLDIQVSACREAAARLGITVIGEFIEPPSTSGYKNRGRNRAKFAEMLAAVKAGEAKAIMVYKSERLSRGGGPGWAPVFDAIDGAGLSADRAVATPNGWMSEFEIGIRATMDREESKKLSDRMTDVRAREAKAGTVHGGGKRPFGYESDHVTIRESEAVLVRELVERVLRGESIFAVVQDWQRREVEASTGGLWAIGSVRRLLASGHIAGLRQHHGEVVAEGAWPGIIDVDTWHAVQAALNARKQGPMAGRTRRYPLSGVLRCELCGFKLVGESKGRGVSQYRCPVPTTNGGKSCGRLSISKAIAEADAFEVLVGAVTSPHTLQRLAAVAPAGRNEAPGLAEEIKALEERQARLVDLYESGDLDKATYRERRLAITARHDAIRAELYQAGPRPAMSGLPTTEVELRAEWDTRGIDWQRLLVQAVIERIDVRPGRGNRLVYTLR